MDRQVVEGNSSIEKGFASMKLYIVMYWSTGALKLMPSFDAGPACISLDGATQQMERCKIASPDLDYKVMEFEPVQQPRARRR